jgi:hypothetical protein
MDDGWWKAGNSNNFFGINLANGIEGWSVGDSWSVSTLYFQKRK